jgi:peptidoglycan/LPS O-acetylase OafA/YrhL
MGWHFAFASNVLFFLRGEYASSLAHFWTLAVEQQFYLFWPLLVLLMPRRWLESAITCLVLLAPVSRLALFAAGYENFEQYNLLPFSNFDSLGLGALTALWTHLPPGRAFVRRKILSCLAIAAILLVVAEQSIPLMLPANLPQTFYAIVFAWIVAAARERIPGAAGRVLEWRPLVGLGIISYGVYVYHVFAPELVSKALSTVVMPAWLQSNAAHFAFYAALTLAAALLSWFLMERPIIEARRSRQARAELRPA